MFNKIYHVSWLAIHEANITNINDGILNGNGKPSIKWLNTLKSSISEKYENNLDICNIKILSISKL